MVQLDTEWPVAAIDFVSVFEHTEQVLVLSPFVSQPGAFVSVQLPILCPVAAIDFVSVVEHTEQVLVLSPFVSQPGAFVCDHSPYVWLVVFAMVSVFVPLQTVHVKVFTPVSLQFAVFVTSPLFHE